MAFVQLPEVRLEYFEHGHGPRTVVFVHGYQASARIWHRVQRALPAEFVAPCRAALGNAPGPQRLVDLALRLGPYGDHFGQREGLNLQQVLASPTGLDLGALQPRLPELLRTPSGCVELLPPELQAEAPALDAVFAELQQQAPGLVVIGRRQVRSNNSWMHNLPTLAKGPERCTLLVHPSDAAAHGLADGQLARLQSAHGELRVPVEISEAMRPGVVSLPHGFGDPGPGQRLAAERPGVNLNALLPVGARDPLSGTAVLSGVAVTLAPA